MSTEEYGYKVNEDMKQELKSQKFKNERLERLLSIFTGDDINGETKERMTEWLAGEFREETEEFLLKLERLRSRPISLPRARDYLHEEVGVGRDTVNEVEGNLDLLLLVYELQSSGELSDTDYVRMMAFANVFAEKSQEVYVLEEELDLDDDVERDVKDHLADVNSHKRHAQGAEVHPGDDQVQIELYSEYGRKPYVSFEFREDGTEDPPSNPDVEYSPSYPLKTIKLELRDVSDGTEVIFSKDPEDGWKTLLEEFFRGVFEIDEIFDELQRRESEIAGDLRETAKTAAEEDEDAVESVGEVIKDRCSSLLEEVRENDNLSEEELEETEERLESVRLAGFIISDDQNTQTDDFRLVSDNFSGFLSSVDSMDEGLEAYIEEAEDENVQVVVEIEDEKVRVQGNTWSPLYGKMSQENLEALRLFFDTLRDE